ncbi:hypothetical protein NP511_01095 [Natrinema thermotolerans]|uniref:Uncharacterized protein n=1 Tax=Natrinema thermotolerans TaxID=121872 RepID=A0AAF0PBM0_9EURY|nr:hypothetical protein [Natrinema thermotolerans]QCC60574.1 hypothetical protein DVR14_18805 [Natrinema thermotolerans]QCC61462.1 hypothetical protein DVR14_22940 [Natrinema thermotolerans]WMT07616.1 hypothetical protein NP511_19810 [Natrinema thermotolerans]WMT08248.1 hypothetical protein NP511_01095 [Natrinema thermotolerans]
MSTRSRSGGGGGFVGAVRADVQRLHGAWMEIVFPRQRGRGHSVMGKWQPESLPQKVAYHGWSALGVVGLLLLYPLTVLGLATRYYAAKLDSTRTRLGIVGVTGIALLGWGLLTIAWGAMSYMEQVDIPLEAVLAVAAASGVATVATALAASATKVGGRGTTVVFAYPFAMTALFLPPVVAALVTPSLHPYILDPSYEFAAWALDNVLVVGGLNEFLRSNFTLEGAAYAGMWLGISFPLGWFFGIVVALANLVRPSQ